VRTRGHPPFFKTLFDLSFTRFLTPRLIPLAYVLGLIVVLAFGAGTSSGGQGISWLASLIVFLCVFVFGAIFVRIQIEVTAVAFRVYERVVPPAEGPID
jgi:uncharacterized protein DUF4282